MPWQLLTVQYAVRGELAIKADVLREQLKTPSRGLHFDKVISSNIRNPQQKGLDQPPINLRARCRPCQLLGPDD
jgi:alanine transaminase